MKNLYNYESDNESAHNFYDELLRALEKSGKTLVEIQRIILPWGNEKSEDMITVDGKQYRNDDEGHSNKTQKKARVRELLNATFAAKEQARAVFQDITKELKKATEDKKASETRYKYMADVAKREFGVTTSFKRKFASESLLPGGVSEGFHDHRPKKQRHDDCGEDDEEDISAVKAELRKEEIMDGIKLEEPGWHRLERPNKVPIPRNWGTPTIKHESQSESQSPISPDYFPRERELSEGPIVSPIFQPTTEIQQIRRRGDEYMKFGENMSSSRATKTFQVKDEDESSNQQFTDKFSIETSPSGGLLQPTKAYRTAPSILHAPTTARDSTWTSQYTNPTTSCTTRNESHFLAANSETNKSATTNADANRFINDLSGLWGLGDTRPDTATSKTNDADIADTPASGSDPGSSDAINPATVGSGSDVNSPVTPDASPVMHKYSTPRIKVNYANS